VLFTGAWGGEAVVDVAVSTQAVDVSFPFWTRSETMLGVLRLINIMHDCTFLDQTVLADESGFYCTEYNVLFRIDRSLIVPVQACG
jgi:hypothetical protein